MLINKARMLVSCPDRSGIVATISRFLYDQGANIVHSDQHTTDPHGGVFFMRIEFDLAELEQRGPDLEQAFEPIAAQFEMNWRIAYAAVTKRIAIFVSKENHCLHELLWQWKAGDIRADIAMVISNHADLGNLVQPYQIPFHHIPVTKETKVAAEAQQLALIDENVDLLVLARYMQILTPTLVNQFSNKIINIHHSFLPAFIGANPYAQANARGVKLIGATAHYVTAELDAGPIIEQDVHRVDHRHNVDDLRRIGRYIERTVLARAVAWHLEDRVLVHGNKTVVFS